MKKLIIPTLMDTYGLIKFWSFDEGMPDGPKQSGGSKRHTYFSHLPNDQMPSERRCKWRICLLQVTPPRPPSHDNCDSDFNQQSLSLFHIFIVPFSQLFNPFDKILLWSGFHGLYAHNFTQKSQLCVLANELIYQFYCEMYKNTRESKQNLDKESMREQTQNKNSILKWSVFVLQMDVSDAFDFCLQINLSS